MYAEAGHHVPFTIQRIFSIYDVPSGEGRGAHAHRQHNQFLIMLMGGVTVCVDEGDHAATQRLSDPTSGLYIPPLVWLELKDFTAGAVCLVLTSHHFDEADYIRDYAEFKQMTSSKADLSGVCV